MQNCKHHCEKNSTGLILVTSKWHKKQSLPLKNSSVNGYLA